MDNQLVPSIMVSLLTLVCVIIVIAGLRKALRFTNWTETVQKSFWTKATLIIILWVVIIGVLSFAGFFRVTNTLPPRPVILIIISLIAAVMWSRSQRMSELLSVMPLHWLVYIQAFRIFVELILWQGYVRGLLPIQMTFEGYNYDIVSGILAILAGWIINHKPASAKVVGTVYNIIGILLLLNILTIAVLSMPTSFRYFTNDPSNIIVGEFPFIFIPGVFVVLAIFMHVFSIRQLTLMKKVNVMEAQLPSKSAKLS